MVEPAVLARAQEVLAPAVLGVLVEDPVAVLHVTGVEVVEVEAVVHGGAVLAQIHGLGTLIDPNLVGSLAFISQ